ncbi:GNAT family N-acetyltransferase [Streptomyces sp. NPDC002845]
MRPSRCRGRTRSAARRPSRSEPQTELYERAARPSRGAAMRDIEIRDDRAAGRLEALAGEEGGEVVGHIQYFVLAEPERALVPVHTIVEPEHEGKGIAGSLARELYGIAAREGSAVAPLCPYVVRWAARHPEEAPAAAPELLRAAEEWLVAHPEGF